MNNQERVSIVKHDGVAAMAVAAMIAQPLPENGQRKSENQHSETQRQHRVRLLLDNGTSRISSSSSVSGSTNMNSNSGKESDEGNPIVKSKAALNMTQANSSPAAALTMNPHSEKRSSYHDDIDDACEETGDDDDIRARGGFQRGVVVEVNKTKAICKKKTNTSHSKEVSRNLDKRDTLTTTTASNSPNGLDTRARDDETTTSFSSLSGDDDNHNQQQQHSRENKATRIQLDEGEHKPYKSIMSMKITKKRKQEHEKMFYGDQRKESRASHADNVNDQENDDDDNHMSMKRNKNCQGASKARKVGTGSVAGTSKNSSFPSESVAPVSNGAAGVDGEGINSCIAGLINQYTSTMASNDVKLLSNEYADQMNGYHDYDGDDNGGMDNNMMNVNEHYLCTVEGQIRQNPNMTRDEAKEAAKREYNRRNAARARVRNKEIVKCLQKRVSELTKLTSELQRANEILRSQVEILTKARVSSTTIGGNTGDLAAPSTPFLPIPDPKRIIGATTMVPNPLQPNARVLQNAVQIPVPKNVYEIVGSQGHSLPEPPPKQAPEITHPQQHTATGTMSVNETVAATQFLAALLQQSMATQQQQQQHQQIQQASANLQHLQQQLQFQQQQNHDQYPLQANLQLLSQLQLMQQATSNNMKTEVPANYVGSNPAVKESEKSASTASSMKAAMSEPTKSAAKQTNSQVNDPLQASIAPFQQLLMAIASSSANGNISSSNAVGKEKEPNAEQSSFDMTTLTSNQQQQIQGARQHLQQLHNQQHQQTTSAPFYNPNNSQQVLQQFAQPSNHMGSAVTGQASSIMPTSAPSVDVISMQQKHQNQQSQMGNQPSTTSNNLSTVLNGQHHQQSQVHGLLQGMISPEALFKLIMEQQQK